MDMRYNLAQERIIIMEEILDNGTAVMDKLEKAFETGSGIDELIREFEQIQPDIQNSRSTIQANIGRMI